MNNLLIKHFFVFLNQVTLDIVQAETASTEHNTTETAKTYKVNCDKRNITGVEDFTVQVLNVSQVSFQSSCSRSLKSTWCLRFVKSAWEQWVPLLILVYMSLRIWWSSWMLTAASALWSSSSLPGVSSPLDWPLTLMPYPEFFPACTSWHWMPLSTAGDLWRVWVRKAPLLQGSCRNRCLSLINHSLRHLLSVLSKKVEIILLCLWSSASQRGLGLWQYPTSSYSRGPNPWLGSTTQTELWRCSPLSSLTKQVWK